MTIDPPSFVRMVGLLPALAILAALPLEWLIAPPRPVARARRSPPSLVAGARRRRGLGELAHLLRRVRRAARRPDLRAGALRRARCRPTSRVALLGAEHFLAVHNELFMIEFPDRTRDVADPAHALPLHQPVTAPLTLDPGADADDAGRLHPHAVPRGARSRHRADGKPLPLPRRAAPAEACAPHRPRPGRSERAGAAPADGGVADPFAPPPPPPLAPTGWCGAAASTGRPISRCRCTVDAGQPTTVHDRRRAADQRRRRGPRRRPSSPWRAAGSRCASRSASRGRTGWRSPCRLRRRAPQLTRWELRPESTTEGLTATYRTARRHDDDASSIRSSTPSPSRTATPPGNGPFIRMPFTATWRGALRVDRAGALRVRGHRQRPVHGHASTASDALRGRVEVPEQPATCTGPAHARARAAPDRGRLRQHQARPHDPPPLPALLDAARRREGAHPATFRPCSAIKAPQGWSGGWPENIVRRESLGGHSQ